MPNTPETQAALLRQVDTARLPRHVAIIMDGNGRWAKARGRNRVFGHHQGVRTVRDIVEAAAELHLEHLTLYTFSTENWNRPRLEIDALMRLLVRTIRKETERLMRNNVRLHTLGNLGDLPRNCADELQAAIAATAGNTGLTLHLALSYSGRWELTQAMQSIAQDIAHTKLTPEGVTESLIAQRLATAGIPDPELLIRTSGEHRLSNFLLWQVAYSELYFTDKFWPDFNRSAFYEALLSYQQRERRFGKTSEQMAAPTLPHA